MRGVCEQAAELEWDWFAVSSGDLRQRADVGPGYPSAFLPYLQEPAGHDGRRDEVPTRLTSN